MDLLQIFTLVLPAGILLCVLLTAIIGISFAIAPDMWAGDYPPDIRARITERSPAARRWQPWVAVIFFATLLGVLAMALERLAGSHDAAGFWDFFLAVFLVLMLFNLFDLLVLDWLIFVWWQPRWVILPGTEGMAGYRDYRFHFLAFLKGSAAITILSALLAPLGFWLN